MARYKMIRVPLTHPVAAFAGMHLGATTCDVYEHKAVLYDKIGPGPHPCHWCGRSLEWKKGCRDDALIADHLDGDPKNNDPANLVAACNGCNTIRGRSWRPAIEDSELTVVDRDGWRTRAAYVSCEICGVPFLASLTRIRKGTVTVCSKKCASTKGHRLRWGTG